MRRFTAFALSLLALSALGQQPRIEEKLDVNVVLIDAVVTDSKGRQILGLDKGDFVVKENGQVMNIDSVDYFTNRQMLNEPENKAAFKVDRVRDDRYFIFFLDKPEDNALFDRLTRARRAISDFIDHRMKPGDLAAIAGHDVRLKIYSDFTDNKAQLHAALDQAATHALGLSGPVSTPDQPSILRNIDVKQMVNHTGTVYEAITMLSDATRPIRARKELVLFTQGILSNDENVRGPIVLNESRYYRPMVNALNGAAVTVYPVNLTLDAPEFSHQTLTRVANETGGEYFRLNTNFESPLKRIEGTTNGYYLIAYRSPHASGERGFQRVNVSVTNTDFRVKARHGYSYGD